MKFIRGVGIFDSLAELVKPEHAALLIVDMQNDFAAHGGFFHKKGYDISMMETAIPRQKQLLDAARESDVFVAFAENTVCVNSDGTLLESPSHISLWDKCGYLTSFEKDEDIYTIDCTWGQRTVDVLSPRDGEPIIRKHRSSAFVRTNLDAMLRERGIKTVVIAGCVTQGCVESTARSAEGFDYYVVIPSDAVASQNRSLHEASLLIMAGRCTIATSDEIAKVWSSANRVQAAKTSSSLSAQLST